MPLGDVVRLAREPFVLVFAALLFFQSGNEFVCAGYVSSFLVRETGLSVRAASWALTGFWAALMLARLVLSRVALRVNGLRLLVLCALASAAGTTLLASSRHPAVAVLAVAWMGAVLAGIFPTALGIVGARYPAVHGNGVRSADHGRAHRRDAVALAHRPHRRGARLAAGDGPRRRAVPRDRRARGRTRGRRHSGFGSGGGPSGT